jgi:hypothetical protein
MYEEWLSAFPVSMPAWKPGMLIILITILRLILLSQTALHSFVRVVSASPAVLAAIACRLGRLLVGPTDAMKLILLIILNKSIVLIKSC